MELLKAAPRAVRFIQGRFTSEDEREESVERANQKIRIQQKFSKLFPPDEV